MSRVSRDISAPTVALGPFVLLRLRPTSIGADLEHVEPKRSWLWRRFDWTANSQGDLECAVRQWCLANQLEIPEEYRLRAIDDEQV